jgi:poly [ADP-ribose] polymerase 7/11/12/13
MEANTKFCKSCGAVQQRSSTVTSAPPSQQTNASSVSGLTGGRENWSSTDGKGMDANKLFQVDNRSHEFVAVEAKFQTTLSTKTVDSIHRIENGLLHEMFLLDATNIEKQARNAVQPSGSSPPGSLRRELFHGTTTAAVDMIVNSTDGHGFLPLLAGSAVGAIYGDGTYFARDAKYSDSYAQTLPSGQKQMLLVDVVVGRWTKGVKGMKTCPVVPGEQYTRFNSLVNDVVKPAIFVVQHSSQAYPKYLIAYH